MLPEPARRWFRMLAATAAVMALPFLAACNDSDDGDDDDNDDSMGPRAVTVMVVSDS